MKPGWMAAAALALLSAGCRGPTELVVVVDSDFEPGVEIGAVDVSASVDGAVATSHTFDLAETELPFSFGVSPGGRHDEPVWITINARDPAGAVVLTYGALVPFVPGEVVRLDVPLARACLHIECGEDETCADGECRSRTVERDELAPGGADDPMPLFDGPRVAPDAGLADASPGCEPGAECFVEGSPCRIGAMQCDADLPVCEEVDRLAAGTVCGEGKVCDEEGRCGDPRNP